VLAAMNTPTVLSPEVLTQGAGEKFDQDGHLIDEATCRFVRELLNNLEELTLRLGHDMRSRSQSASELKRPRGDIRSMVGSFQQMRDCIMAN
jgi:hypothetical protein